MPFSGTTGCTQFIQPAAFPSILSTSGTTLVDANGHTMPQLKGFVMQPNGLPATDYQIIAAKGARIIRTPIFWGPSGGGGNGLQPYGNSSQVGPPAGPLDFSGIDTAVYVPNLDTHIQNCLNNNLYVLFTFYFSPQATHVPSWTNITATYSGSAVNVNTLTGSQSLATTTGSLSTAGFPSSGYLRVPDASGTALVGYTGLSGGSFTGCTYIGGPTGIIMASGTISAGGVSNFSTYVNYAQAATSFLAQRYGDPTDPQGFWAGIHQPWQPVVVGMGCNEITPDFTNGQTWMQYLVNSQASTMVAWMRTYAPHWIASISCGFGASAPQADANGSGHGSDTYFSVPANAVPGGNYYMELHDYLMASTDGSDTRTAQGLVSNPLKIGTNDTTNSGGENHTTYPPTTGGSLLSRAQCQSDQAEFLASYQAYCSSAKVPLGLCEFGWAPLNGSVPFSGAVEWITDKMAAWAALNPAPVFLIEWDWQTNQGNDPFAAFPGSGALGAQLDGWQTVTDIFMA